MNRSQANRGQALARRNLVKKAGGCCLEGLEARRLLAAISWDGGAADNLWSSPNNWSGNALPGAADQVTIGAGFNAIQYTGAVPVANRVVNTLTTASPLNFTGTTFTVSATADINADMAIAGGTINGGAWDVTGATNGGITATASGGTITDAAITGDINCATSSAFLNIGGTTRFGTVRLQANSSQARFAPGYTLLDTVVSEGAAAGARSVSLSAAGTLNIGATGVIRLGSSSGAGLNITEGGTMNLVNGGLITAEAPTQTLSINVTTWSNPGTISGASGTTLTFLGAWSDAGNITLNNTTLNLNGTFSTSGFNFAGLTRTGGTVNLVGTLNNAAATLTLNAATGSWNMLGGTINNGSMAFANSQTLVMTTSAGILNNVQVNGDLLFTTTSSFINVLGTTRFANARLQANNSQIRFAPGYVLQDTVVAEGAAAGNRSIFMTALGTLTIGNTGVVRLEAGTGGGLNFNEGSAMTLVNNGLISAEAASQTLNINVTSFTNNSTVQVTDGTLSINTTNWSNPGTISGASGATVTFLGAWSDAGTLTVNNATLNLNGTFSTSGFNFAGFTRTGGTVNLVGTLNNAASTLTLNAATGTWNLLGGTINGGTLAFANSQTLVPTPSGGTLNNLQVNGDLLFTATSAFANFTGTTRFGNARLQANNSQIRFAPGYVLQDTVVAEGAAAGNRSIFMTALGTLTIGNTGVVRLAAGAGGGLTFNEGSAMTLVNNGLISAEAASQTLSINVSSFTNNTTLQATFGTISINTTNWSNPGTITGANGTTLTFLGAWSDAGTVSINGATLNLNGTFSTTGFNFAGFTRAGASTVNLVGVLTNTATTFTLNTATGSWNLLGGTINGGTLAFANGQTLLMTPSGGTLNNLQVNGDLLFTTTSALANFTGSTRFGNARLQANNSQARFGPGYTLLDTVVVEGATAGNRSIFMTALGTLTIGNTGVVRVAAGAGGGLNFTEGGAMTLVNNGLIVGAAAGQTLGINVTSFTNNATVQAADGTLSINTNNWSNQGTITGATGATVTFLGAWSNPGIVSVNGATLNLNGTFSTTGFNFAGFSRTGGAVNVVGVLTNTGSTLTLNAATGTWNLQGGTINDGSLAFANSQTLAPTTAGGTLNNVQVNGDLIFTITSSIVNILGSTRFANARLQANNSQIRFSPGYVLQDTVVVEGAAAGNRGVLMTALGTLTIGSTGVVRIAPGSGGGLNFSEGSAMTLINNGLISAEAASQTLTFNITSFTNNTTLQATGGTVTINVPTVTNYNGTTNTLTGGAWAFTNASIAWNAATIRTIAAATSVTFGGTGTLAPFAQLTTNNGLLTLNSGRVLTITPQGGTLTNNGTITSTAGVGTLAATNSLNSPSTLTATGTGTLQVNALGSITGNVVPAAGGTVAFGTTRTLSTGTYAGAGTIAFNNNAATTIAAAAFNPSILATSNGGDVILTGNLTVGAVVNAGVITLGLHTLTVTGNYTQTVDGALELRLTSLATRGRLTVGGNANLDGAIRVDHTGYTLVRDDESTLITTGGVVNGTFAVESAGGIENVEIARMVYTANSVIFHVYAAGDFDGDGFITGVDFDLFVQGFEAGDVRVDMDGDGFVTGADFDIFVVAFEHG